jgi:hypothetical protein
VADGTAGEATSRRRMWTRTDAPATDGSTVSARDTDGDGLPDDEEDAPKTGVFSRLRSGS